MTSNHWVNPGTGILFKSTLQERTNLTFIIIGRYKSRNVVSPIKVSLRNCLMPLPPTFVWLAVNESPQHTTVFFSLSSEQDTRMERNYIAPLSQLFVIFAFIIINSVDHLIIYQLFDLDYVSLRQLPWRLYLSQDFFPDLKINLQAKKLADRDHWLEPDNPSLHS